MGFSQKAAITVLQDLDLETGEGPATAGARRLHHCMFALAEHCIDLDHIQRAADILAFLLRQTDADPATLERAEDRFAELESRVCPRLILDARKFAADMDLPGMIEYSLDVVPHERI